MIVQHELLEQLIDDSWQPPKVISSLVDCEADAWQSIARHTQEGNLCFLSSDGSVMSVEGSRNPPKQRLQGGCNGPLH